MERRRSLPRVPAALLALLGSATAAHADPGSVSEEDGGEIRLNVGIGLAEG